MELHLLRGSWQKKIGFMRGNNVNAFFISPLWIIYDIAVGSWAGILDEIVSEASMLISIFRYGWKNMDSLETEA